MKNLTYAKRKQRINKFQSILITIIIGVLLQIQTSCGDNSKINQQKEKSITKKSNPVVYFEIPVNDLDRAIKFYSSVFKFEFTKETIDKNRMGLFPFTEDSLGISGALAKGEIYKPTKNGVLIYFKTESIDETLKLAIASGGKILYPRTDNEIGLVAEFEDTEGNRIALYEAKK
ncbi:MAG: VOC family protein [Leptospiraceae bacterium]|nr:VOC family protein [Leptospiraceae bacterium]